MKRIKKLLMIGTFAVLPFSIIVADDMNAELHNKLHSAVDNIESLSNEISSLLERTDKEIATKQLAYADTKNRFSRKSTLKKTIQPPSTLQQKPADERNFTVTKGDFSLGIGGKTRIEHFYQKNIALLNAKLPDQAEYFKNTFDLIIDANYGQQTFGHNAVQAFTDIRHKGVWGRGAVYADSDSSTPTDVNISESSLGSHRHTNGKPLLWIKDAWLKFSINAAMGKKNPERVHYVQLGWFPFELGRGIALGSFYGLNRELLGLYSYPEDKSAPGISISGDIVKNVLTYALYYGKFEERNKSLSDTFNTIKAYHVGRQSTPWRGLGKDDEVVAAHLKWKVLNKSALGTLELEPYIMYNEASDQQIERAADVKTELGTFGLNVEHSYKQFEWGGEVACNFGNEILRAIDRNQIRVERDANGFLVEKYSHILDAAGGNNVLVTATSKAAAQTAGDHRNNNTQIAATGLWNKDNRFRPSYKNKLSGWMGVIDAAYKINTLTFAASYGYASGDENPQTREENKTYKGFIGLHEIYSGKRVKSVLLLDQRLLFTPSSLHTDDKNAAPDFAFSDLAHIGLSTTWKPNFAKSKNIEINPNAMFFWKASSSKKYDPTHVNPDGSIGGASTEDARKYMGVELSLFSSMEIIKNLKLFGIFAAFVPGSYFTDIKGVPNKNNDIWNKLSAAAQAGKNPADYRLGDDTAYHVNIGLEYKF